jgi:hypothetical protein
MSSAADVPSDRGTAVHFGRHDAFRARDLAEFAVEPDLMAALANDVSPHAADSEVDVTTSHSDVSNPHQRFTSSGVVYALNTNSAGASKSRVIRSPCPRAG